MDAKIKARWIKALKSKKYKQGKAALKTEEGFCCLGVLCDLYAKAHKLKWKDGCKANQGMTACSRLGRFPTLIRLPAKVRDWAGLKQNDPQIGLKKLSMNDEGMDFKNIALLIDSAL